MSYSMEVIKREIDKLIARNTKLEELIKYCPAIELLGLRSEFSKKLESGVDRTSPEFIKWIGASAKKEKTLLRKMKTMQKDEQKLWDEKQENSHNLNDLSNAYSILNIRNAA